MELRGVFPEIIGMWSGMHVDRNVYLYALFMYDVA